VLFSKSSAAKEKDPSRHALADSEINTYRALGATPHPNNHVRIKYTCLIKRLLTFMTVRNGMLSVCSINITLATVRNELFTDLGDVR
jgi:hypothetical protein